MLRCKKISGYFSIVLIGVFILQMGMNTIVFMNFKLNQSYISKEVCVNRNNPASTCVGKCYLKSQLQKSDAKEKQLQSYCKDKLTLFFQVVGIVIDKEFIAEKSHYTFFYIHALVPISEAVFHPPAV